MNDELIGFIPPQNLEAEEYILGALLFDGDEIKSIKGILEPEDFYREAHRRIFRAMIAILEAGEPIDIVTVSERLKMAGDDQLKYLSGLADGVPTSANIKHHADIVAEHSRKRKLIDVCRQTINQTLTDSLDDCLDALRGRTSGLVTGRGIELVSMKQIAKQVFDQVEYRYNHKNEISGITSGIADIDEITDGWQAGTMVVLAARPGQGKSALAMQFAQAAGVPVGIISLEMGPVQLGIRSLASLSRVDMYKLRKGFLASNDWPMLIKAAKEMAEMPIYFTFTAQKISEIDRAITEMIEKYKVRMVIVDYLQRASANNVDHNMKREEEVAKISRYLKGVALVKNMPVMPLAQLNRAIEARSDKEPTLADLRESGQIEQDADIVMFIKGKYAEKGSGPASLIFAKGRNEGRGRVELYFNGDTMQFRTRDGDHES